MAQWFKKKKKSAHYTGDLGLIPGYGRTTGEGDGYLLQYSCLGNPWTEEPDQATSMRLQKELDTTW